MAVALGESVTAPTAGGGAKNATSEHTATTLPVNQATAP